ncbi:LLM class flavin-dependent oxidoreductase [Micromonospora deserti]|uniref:LLM class flavin-dependent oxidoreductase n=1 Tax=Micromonospora deserti TaxID=2070366 RepID=A0A2W2BIF8_9ACTN|nr:LLM class flavin-dependent oxidoreductase [Micromonospora deserti]PZF85040.1 LLM class flavin-dependent oxidoreductase [Micromonospora deserti]
MPEPGTTAPSADRRPLQFGVTVDPTSADPGAPGRLARVADIAGLDLVAVQDHPYQPTFLDALTLIATLVPQTRRIRFVTNVVSLPLRPPAMLAKAAASLDVLSGGRFELGLGAGGAPDGIASMGGPRRTPADSVAALEESITVARLMWSGGTPHFAGRHYTLDGVHAGPVPPHPINIWLGAIGDRMLDLTGRAADGWLPSLPYVPPQTLPARHARIDDAAQRAGRDPATIHRIYNLTGHIGPTGSRPLNGPVALWVDELTRFTVELGMTGYLYWPNRDHERQIELFANEVVPAVREAVSSARRVDGR